MVEVIAAIIHDLIEPAQADFQIRDMERWQVNDDSDLDYATQAVILVSIHAVIDCFALHSCHPSHR